jgi:hypothetical protein
MKKTILAATVAAVALCAILAFSGPASAQSTDGLVYCGPTIGYAAVCPNDVERPAADPGVSAGSLARTGSDSLPLARMAFVLIGVGGALTVIAGRKRLQHSPA